MIDFVVSIEGGFSTSKFYNILLKKLHNYFELIVKEKKHARLVLDFTKTKYIDSLIIPNLLCIGEIIKSFNTPKPLVATVNNSIYNDNHKILQYLNDIGFIKQAQNRDLFEFNSFVDDKNSILPDYCTTFFFDRSITDKNAIANKIEKRSNELFKRHLSEFYESDPIFGFKNFFAKTAAELCQNSSIHADSFSYMTIQASSLKNTVYIAVSDWGKGLLPSLTDKIINNKLEHELYTLNSADFLRLNKNKASLYSLIECTFYRYYDSPYGICDIAKTVLKNNGIFRLHSNSSRIILTPQTFGVMFDYIKNQNELKEVLYATLVKNEKYNFQHHLKFGGVHYEIEIPIKARREAVRSVYTRK